MLVECEHCEATVDAEILEGYEHHGPRRTDLPRASTSAAVLVVPRRF